MISLTGENEKHFLSGNLKKCQLLSYQNLIKNGFLKMSFCFIGTVRTTIGRSKLLDSSLPQAHPQAALEPSERRLVWVVAAA